MVKEELFKTMLTIFFHSHFRCVSVCHLVMELNLSKHLCVDVEFYNTLGAVCLLVVNQASFKPSIWISIGWTPWSSISKFWAVFIGWSCVPSFTWKPFFCLTFNSITFALNRIDDVSPFAVCLSLSFSFASYALWFNSAQIYAAK